MAVGHDIHVHHDQRVPDLLGPPGDQHPEGLAEEGGEEGVEGGLGLQEAVHLVQQGRVRGQLLVDLKIEDC